LLNVSSYYVAVLQAVGVSDHRVQVVEVDVPVLRQAPETRRVRAFKKCDWDSSLSNASWSVMEIFDDINDM